jgi:hypothetical protein
MKKLIALICCYLTYCSPKPPDVEPYKPLPADTDKIEVSPECQAACKRLRELQCGADDVNPCEEWLCAAEFQDFAAIAKAEACPL